MPSIGTKQLTLTLKITTPLLVEMLVTVDNSALQEYTHLDDHFYYSTSLFTMLFACLLVDTLSAHSHKILDVLTLINFPCKAQREFLSILRVF